MKVIRSAEILFNEIARDDFFGKRDHFVLD
jgi:hypothetical protein